MVRFPSKIPSRTVARSAQVADDAAAAAANAAMDDDDDAVDVEDDDGESPMETDEANGEQAMMETDDVSRAGASRMTVFGGGHHRRDNFSFSYFWILVCVFVRG